MHVHVLRLCSGPHGSARAACLSPAHQVEQSDPVHRAGTSAPIRSCVMCSAATSCATGHTGRRSLSIGALRTCYSPSMLTSLCTCFRRAPGGSASQRRPSDAIRPVLRRYSSVVLSVQDPDHMHATSSLIPKLMTVALRPPSLLTLALTSPRARAQRKGNTSRKEQRASPIWRKGRCHSVLP